MGGRAWSGAEEAETGKRGFFVCRDDPKNSTSTPLSPLTEKNKNQLFFPTLTCVVGGPAVVCRREQRDQVPLRESLETIHDALVRADDHLELVLLAKLDDSVGPESDEPGASRGGLHALDGVVGRRIGPEQVHKHEAAVLHLQRSLQLGDLLNPADGPADAPVHAQDAVLDERGQREVVEERVEPRPGPDAVRVAQALDALKAEAEEGVDVGGLEREREFFSKKKRGETRSTTAPLGLPCGDEKIDQRVVLAAFAFFSFLFSSVPPNAEQTHLVVASDQVHRGRVLDLEREQQADGLERVRAAVDVVAEEKIVDVRDVPSGARRAVLLEKAHQITELAVQVSEDLDRG